MDQFVPPDARKRALTLDRRRVLLGGSFLLTAAVAATRVPHTRIDLLGARKLENVIPTTIGRWSFYSNSGLVVPPKDQLKDDLYSQLLTRVYTARDELPIMLLIAQGGGQTGVLQVHRPEVCYPAGGYHLTESVPHEVPLQHGAIDTRQFTAMSDSRIEQLIYWTRVGRDLPISWVQQRWSVAKANLRGEIPDAVLVRVSTISPDREGSMAVLDEFIRALVAAVPAAVRPFLDNSTSV